MRFFPKFQRARNSYNHICIRLHSELRAHPQLTLFAVGALSLTLGLTKLAHAQDSFDDYELRFAVCQNFKLIEGPYGALLMTVAGIGAIVSSAIGKYQAAYQMITVGVGAFILRSLVSLWFGTDYDQCRDSSFIDDLLDGEII